LATIGRTARRTTRGINRLKGLVADLLQPCDTPTPDFLALSIVTTGSNSPATKSEGWEELQVDKSEINKEYDRLVDGPAARQWLEKERPSLVAARDQAIVELRREKSRKKLLKSHTGSPGCAGKMTAASDQALPTFPVVQLLYHSASVVRPNPRKFRQTGFQASCRQQQTGTKVPRCYRR